MDLLQYGALVGTSQKYPPSKSSRHVWFIYQSVQELSTALLSSRRLRLKEELAKSIRYENLTPAQSRSLACHYPQPQHSSGLLLATSFLCRAVAQSQPTCFSCSSHQKLVHGQGLETTAPLTRRLSERPPYGPQSPGPNCLSPSNTLELISYQLLYLCQPRPQSSDDLVCLPSTTCYQPKRSGGRAYERCRCPWSQNRRASTH